MNELSLLNQICITSLDIAELIGSRHTDVKRSIERLIKSEVISTTPLAQCVQTKGNNRTYVTDYYKFIGEQGKRDSIIVVAQIRPEVTAKIVDRWLELENQNKLPTTYIEALQQLIHKEQEKQQLIETNTTLQEQKEQAKLRNGESILGASLKQVNTKLNSNYTWQPLRKYCSENELEPNVIYPNGYDCIPITVYPYEAWLNVYELDLNLIFN